MATIEQERNAHFHGYKSHEAYCTALYHDPKPLTKMPIPHMMTSSLRCTCGWMSSARHGAEFLSDYQKHLQKVLDNPPANMLH